MRPKEVDRLARGIFAKALPPTWIPRDEQDQEDYGVDYEIEFEDSAGKPTGALLKVQLKGTASPEYSEDGRRISCSSLKVERMEYYLEKLDVPVALVLVDVNAEKCYWATLSGNPEVDASYLAAREKRQATLTITIDTARTLPETATDLVEEASSARYAVLFRNLSSTPADRLLATSLEGATLEKNMEALSAHYTRHRFAAVWRKVQTGDFQAFFREAKAIFLSDAETTEARFNAGMLIIQGQTVVAGELRTPKAHETLAEARVEFPRFSRHLVGYT